MTENINFEQSVKDRLKQKRSELGIDYNILIKKFFIDEFLIRLSKTKYREKFVWKGGFVLSAISGIENQLNTHFSIFHQSKRIRIIQA